MGKALRLLLAALLALSLCACGSAPSETPAAAPAPAADPDPNLGRYLCTAVTVDGMDLGPEGQWILLKEDGLATVYLDREPDEGSWSLNGSLFSLSITGDQVGTGILEDGIMTLDLMGAHWVFLLEGVTPLPAEPAPAHETGEDFASISCYGDLYSITYPTGTFLPPEDGLTDLTGIHDGTSLWLSALDSREALRRWHADAESRQSQDPALAPETFSAPAGDHTAEVILYQDADGWHAAILVEFDKDLGTDAHPMYAACLYIQGSSRETVWNDTIQTMVASLRLGT